MMLAGKKVDYWRELRESLRLDQNATVSEAGESRGPGTGNAYSGLKEDPRPHLDMAEELERVARVFGVEADQLRAKRKNFPPKLAAYYHLVEIRGATIKQVAELLHVSPCAVSLGIQRFK